MPDASELGYRRLMANIWPTPTERFLNDVMGFCYARQDGMTGPGARFWLTVGNLCEKGTSKLVERRVLNGDHCKGVG